MTHLMCGGMMSNHFIANFSQCTSERILKVGQYLVKVSTKVGVMFFLTHSVV